MVIEGENDDPLMDLGVRFFRCWIRTIFVRQGDRLNMGANVSTSHERFSSMCFSASMKQVQVNSG